MLAEVNAQNFQVFNFSKRFNGGISDGLLHVIGTNTLEFFGVFQEGKEGGLIDIFAEGNINRSEIFAGFTQLDDDSIIDGD